MAANFLIIALMLIEISLWLYFRHRPSRRAWPILVRISDFISLSVKNDCSAVAEDTGSVAKTLRLTKKLPQQELSFDFYQWQSCKSGRVLLVGFGLFFVLIYNFKLFSGSGLHFRVRAGFGPDLVGPLTTLISGACYKGRNKIDC